MNLPTDMDITAIKSFFDIGENCEVVVDKINTQRAVVKIVAPENLTPGILKFNQMKLHQRKIGVLIVDKCKLGADCSRKVCRFGHEERFGNGAAHKNSQNSNPTNNRDEDIQHANSPKNTAHKEPSIWKIKKSS